MAEPTKSKYPNLYRRPKQEWWTYRKFSSVRRKEFVVTLTGVASEAKAYAAGVKAFNDWLEQRAGSTRSGATTISDLALEVLNAKTSARASTQKRAKSVIENHVVPAFGHLSPDKVTDSVWADYVTSVRSRNEEFRFFNTRKYLKEMLGLAHSRGLIKEVPKLPNPDAEPAPPKHLKRHEIRAILHECSPEIRLLLFIAWKMGARPGEILQYRWSMIDWKAGEHGAIHIPGSITKTKRARSIPLNSRVSRVLTWLKTQVESEDALFHEDGNFRARIARRRESDFIFPSKSDPKKHRTMLRNGWDETIKRASCRLYRCKGKCRHPKIDAVIYNLRDTFITDKLIQGVTSTFIAKYVDSSTREIDKRYAVQVRSTMEQIAG